MLDKTKSIPTWHPYSIEAEQSLLGAILVNNEAFQLVSDSIEPVHFYEPVHAQIFEICASLIRAGKLASPITIRPFLPVDIEIVRGLKLSLYIARLAAEATTVINARDFAQIIRDLSDARFMGEIGKTLEPAGGRDPMELAGWAIEQLDQIIAGRTIGNVRAVTMGEAVAKTINAAAIAYQNDGKILGVPYGLRDLDARTLGASPADMVVMAGRPGMGKSALLLSIVRKAAIAGHAGVIFSQEMDDVQLTMRLITDEMYDKQKLTYWQLKSGKYHESMFDYVRDAAENVAQLPIKIDQQPALTMQQIAARARQLKRTMKIRWFAIDHLGLMRDSGRYNNRVHAIGEITAGVKALARELDCVGFLLSQLSRQVEARDNKRPSLADLRDSGTIEQDADVVLMLYREAYYLAKKEPMAGTADYKVWLGEMEQCANVLEILIEKQRQGPVGTVKCFVDIGANVVRDLDMRGDMA